MKFDVSPKDVQKEFLRRGYTPEQMVQIANNHLLFTNIARDVMNGTDNRKEIFSEKKEKRKTILVMDVVLFGVLPLLVILLIAFTCYHS